MKECQCVHDVMERFGSQTFYSRRCAPGHPTAPECLALNCWCQRRGCSNRVKGEYETCAECRTKDEAEAGTCTRCKRFYDRDADLDRMAIGIDGVCAACARCACSACGKSATTADEYRAIRCWGHVPCKGNQGVCDPCAAKPKRALEWVAPSPPAEPRDRRSHEEKEYDRQQPYDMSFGEWQEKRERYGTGYRR